MPKNRFTRPALRYRNETRKLSAWVIMASLIMFAASSGRATVITYTDRTAWESALQNVVNSDLETEALTAGFTPYTSVDGWMVNAIGLPATVSVLEGTGSNNMPLLTKFFYLQTGNEFGIPPRFQLQFPGAQLHHGFGFDYNSVDSGWTLEANGDVLHSFTFGETGFLGFINTTGTFTDYLITGPSGDPIGFAIDNLTTGDELGCTAALPAHARNVGFGTRGYWFEAPNTFDIAALKAPVDLAPNLQSVEILRIDDDPSDFLFPNTSTTITSLFYAQGEPGGEYIVIDPPLRIQAGDRIGILGGTSANGLTTRSSYSANLSGPFLSDIAGYPAQFYRLASDQSVAAGPIASIFYSPWGELGRFEIVVANCAVAASCDCTPAWAVRSTTGPPPRINGAMVYDSNRNVTVLFGGLDEQGVRLNDTWEHDGTSWTQRFPAQSPSARTNSGVAFDSARNVTVLYGGSDGDFLDDTWEWNGNSWSLNPTAQGVGHHSMAMAYDPIRQVVVRQGGSAPGGRDRATFEYDGFAWTVTLIASPPGFRSRHSMVYDPALQKLVMYGGQAPGSVVLSDTWTYDGTWAAVSTSGPGPRLDHLMAGDLGCGGVYLYGGSSNNSTTLAGLWKLEAGVWAQVVSATAASPGELWRQHLVYDSVNEGLLLFGGSRSAATILDSSTFTWRFSCGQDLSYVDHHVGFEHWLVGDAIGSAFIDSIGGSNLTIANIGSSGLDGVAINYGDATSFHMLFSPGIPPLDDTMASVVPNFEDLSNTSNDIEDEQFIALRGDSSAGGTDLSADFSSLGATGYTAQAFVDTNVVFVQSGIANGVSGVLFPAAIDIISRGINSDGSVYYEIANEDSTVSPILIVGGSPVAASRVRLVSENASIAVTHFDGTQFHGTALPDLTIGAESVGGLDGVAMTGSASLPALRGEQSGDALRLSFSPADGMADEGVVSSWRPQGACDWRINMDWQALEGGSPPAVGSILRFSATGDVAGVADEELGELSVSVSDPTAGALSLDFAADYSAIGSSTHTVQLLNAGIVVAEFPGVSGGFNLVVPSMPTGAGQQRLQLSGLDTAGFRMHWAVPESLVFGLPKAATAIFADEIAVLAEAPSGIITRLSSFGVFADGYSEMLLVSSQAIPTSTGDQIPTHLIVQRAFPNPFNPRVVIHFSTGKPEPVRVNVYDLAGRRVSELLRNESLPAGSHQLVWDGTDRRGAQVSSGVYLFRIQSGNESVSMKATLLR